MTSVYRSLRRTAALFGQRLRPSDSVLVEMHEARIPELHDEAESLRERIEAERLSETIRLDWI